MRCVKQRRGMTDALTEEHYSAVFSKAGQAAGRWGIRGPMRFSK